ncbi:hypothetical protein RvY_08663 [Ramazzottius varieornatus]|uniref:EF-hand domain-containing protein n=1 Tax=Ramazzottius varieornatus TaxID=947166 RepID=A0A1D1V6L1_RAMVA|nr:hypothetical protein RvY_08663 [Ramazzottius varieornatus]
MGKRNSKLKADSIQELADKTHFTEKELRQWHKCFIKDCPEGALSREAFLRIYAEFFPNGGDPTKFGNFLFKVFDQNKDGMIQFHEFIHALSITSRGNLDEKLNWAFRLYDIDDDGYITRAEMLHIIAAIYGMVGKTEDSEGRSPELRVERIFQMMDKNHDDKLSMDEFREGTKSDPAILQALSFYDGIV